MLKRRASELPGNLMQLPVLLPTGWGEQGRESVGMDTQPVTFSLALSRSGMFVEVYDASCRSAKCVKQNQKTKQNKMISLRFQVSNDFTT